MASRLTLYEWLLNETVGLVFNKILVCEKIGLVHTLHVGTVLHADFVAKSGNLNKTWRRMKRSFIHLLPKGSTPALGKKKKKKKMTRKTTSKSKV